MALKEGSTGMVHCIGKGGWGVHPHNFSTGTIPTLTIHPTSCDSRPVHPISVPRRCNQKGTPRDAVFGVWDSSPGSPLNGRLGRRRAARTQDRVL